MYALVLVNTTALAATHWTIAPRSLTLAFPGLLAFISLVRLLIWWRARNQVIDDVRARLMLRQTLVFAALMGCAFSVWSFSLFPYGDAFSQAHVMFYMAVTSIGSVCCLMHMRAAATLLTAFIIGPVAIFLVSRHNMVMTAIGLNLVLVAITMLVILRIAYRDFANLVESRRDLQQRQAEIQQLSDGYRRLANTDGLTGLPNRRHFFQRIAEEIQAAAAAGRSFAVGVIDLDGFKPVNDAYGHSVGDTVLIEASARLTRDHGARVFVARLGGDEFGLIVQEDMDHDALQRLGVSLCGALGAPYCLAGVTAQVSGSAGFAVYPHAAASLELLYERADYALYHAKQNLRGATVVFSSEHETAIREASVIEQALRHADIDKEFHLAFQPLVDVRRQRTAGFEALARWNSPSLGAVSPAVFVAVAERSGLIAPLSLALLSKALEAAATWPDDVRLSFNLSARDVASPQQIERIVDVIRASGLDPRRLDLEVTETAVMRDLAQAERALSTLKALGAHIALDDFGVGYSSLSHVDQLPIDKLKIDGSFMRGLTDAGKRRAIVKTILDMCRNLELDCVVEGVESGAELALLLPMGCEVVQGYLFSRPMSSQGVADYLQAERTRSAEGAAFPEAMRAAG